MISVFDSVVRRDISALKAILLQLETERFSAIRSPKLSSSPSRSPPTKSPHQRIRSDINDFNQDGLTPLLLAFKLGDRNIIDALINSYKVNINAQDKESGYTLLHKCFYHGELKIAYKILCERRDVDLEIRDREGNTCLDVLDLTLTLKGHPTPIQNLLRQADARNQFRNEKESNQLNNNFSHHDTEESSSDISLQDNASETGSTSFLYETEEAVETDLSLVSKKCQHHGMFDFSFRSYVLEFLNSLLLDYFFSFLYFFLFLRLLRFFYLYCFWGEFLL